jgi:hypothetical protein
VQRILRDRKQQTLGYEPPTPIESQPAPKPSRSAYAKIPASPVSPRSESPIEPLELQLPYEQLGPVRLGEEALAPRQLVELESVQREMRRRLELGPPASPADVRRFDLFSVLDYAVQNSRSYQNRMEDLYLAALNVTLQRHLLSPRPFVRTGVQYRGGDEDVNYRSALAVTNTVGIRQQLPYGGEVVAQALVDFVSALNDTTASGESATLVLSGSIPLLRGAGLVNLEGLISSERQLVYEVRRFEDFRRAFAVQIASQYFSLLATAQAIDNQRRKFQQAVELTERNLQLFAAGRVRFFQVQQALTQQLSDEAALITAQQRYQNSLDSFKIQIGMPVEQELDLVPVELELNIPEVHRADVAQMALKYRLDVQTARDQIEDAQRQVEIAKNNLLPDLTLRARTDIGNRPGTPARQIDQRSQTYTAGFDLDLPVDRLPERNRYRSALITFERSTRNFRDITDRVVADVRQSARGVEQAQIQLELARQQIDVARSQLEYSNELLTQGNANVRDVTDSQQALLRAQNNFDNARADLQISVLQFLRDTGTLRMDPQAGALGHAMDLAAARYDQAVERRPLE